MDALTIRRNRGIAVPYQGTGKTERTAGSGQSQKAAAKPGFTISETLRQLMTQSSKAEAGYRESRQTLQTGEAVLAQVQDSLGRMAELAEQAADGGEVDREALQAELEKLLGEIDRMTGSAAAGGVQLFLDGGVDMGAGAEALLRALLGEAAGDEKAAQALPEWLVRAAAQDGFSTEELLSGLGLEPGAGGAEILAAVANASLEDNEAAAYLAALYLGAVISGGTPSGGVDPAEALDGLRQLLEQVARGMDPDQAVEKLTNGEITSLADFQEQFTGLSLPGMQEFLLDLLTSQLGASVVELPSLLTLLAGSGGMNLDLVMGLLAALEASSDAAAQASGETTGAPEAAAASLAETAAPEAAAGRTVSVLELGNVQVIGRDLSGVALDEAAGVLTISGSADVTVQGTGRGEQAILITGSGTVTLRQVDAPEVTVDAGAARVFSSGTNHLGTVQVREGATLTLGGSGLLRIGTLRANESSVLRLTGGAVAVEGRDGEEAPPLAAQVVIEGTASLLARALRVSDGNGKALEPFDVIWKALLPGFHSITSLNIDGRQAKLAFLAGDPPDPLRLWLAKGDLSAHGYPAHGVEIRGRDASGDLRTRYTYLRWSRQFGGFEEMVMYPNPFTVTGGEEDVDWRYDEESHTLHILSGRVTAISGGVGLDAAQAPFSGRIALADEIGVVTLTLGGVVCRVQAGRAFDLGRGNDVTLLLQSGTDNFFESGEGFAGISLGEGTSLQIDRAESGSGQSAGTLTANGGAGGAGIGRDSGGGRDRNSHIRIRGGVVTANGTGGGAGIGGALGTPVGNIEIRGGTVSAAAVFHAAAIGAGIQGDSGDIHITGTARIEKAAGGDPGADIGACLFGGCGKVVISGGADIGRAKLRMQSGIPLKIGSVTVTLPQFRLSSRALEIRKMSLTTRKTASEAKETIELDRRWVAQIQAAYSALYSQVERSFNSPQGLRTEGPVRDAGAASTLLEDVARSIPLPDSRAMQTHSKRGREDVHQLLR